MSLFGPVYDEGFCLRDENCAVDRLNWCDFSAPLMSGDIVMLFLKRRHGIEIAFKILERTRDGRFWFTAWHTREESSRIAYPVLNQHTGTLALPLYALAPVVKRQEIPRKTPRQPFEPGERDEDFGRYLYDVGAVAIDEWNRLGFPPRAQFDFTNNPEHIARLHAGRSVRPQFA